MTMPHRSNEWQGTLAQLRLAVADSAFSVHGPVPAPFGDEGAANHMRLCDGHDAAGIEIFVYGIGGRLKPAGVICEIMNEDGTMARLDDQIGREARRERGCKYVSISLVAVSLKNI